LSAATVKLSNLLPIIFLAIGSCHANANTVLVPTLPALAVRPTRLTYSL
jgi:hypothetical protein